MLSTAGPARGKPVVNSPELERLRADIRRIERALVALAAFTALLAVAVLILLAR